VSGLLARLEYVAADARAALLAQPRDTNLVVVGIDPQSLQTLSEWPWPRRHHARLLQQLMRAEPRSVFLDIDFSARTTADDDGLLEQALAAWTQPKVVLATHFQPLSGADSTLAVTRPLAAFAAHATLASVILEPSSDGLVREMRSSYDIAGETLHSVFALAGEVPPNTVVPIDFSLRPESFSYVSFIDVLNGSAVEALRGKDVFVGPTAWELGDVLQVPVYRSLPGVVVQALAAESVRAGVLQPLAPLWFWTLLVAWTAAGAASFARSGWRRNLVAVAAGSAVLVAASCGLYASQRIVLDIVPFAAVLLALFVAATARSLDQQTWRALQYALGLKRRDALIQSIVASTTDSILCVDEQTTIKTGNPAAARLFRTSQLIGARLDALVPNLSGTPPQPLDALVGTTFERHAHNIDGEAVPVEIALSRIATEEGRLYTAIIRDISERHAQRRALEYQAMHDPLTGLPNRTALNTRLTALLQGGPSPNASVALLMLDLCRFKEVNDTLGHDVGDDVLCEVARRFGAATDDAFICRIGGDEFTMVLANVASRAELDLIVRRIVDSLRTPIDARGIAIEVGVSIGIALAPGDARDAKDLLRHADVAMYVAKRQGTACEYYARDLDQHTVRRLSMLSELRTAIDGSGISLHYQPQIELATGRVEGVEALVRWQHPLHGAIGPAEFVTLAESSDLIRPLTDWTIAQALADVASWNRRGLALRVAINVSARVLRDEDLRTRVAELLASSGVPPHQIELEITESAMMTNPERARASINELRKLGVLISIDDYGTGFSSLGYLRDLQVHTLKLDRSFVVDLETRVQNRVIVESTLKMAHALGLRVVAEGVETEWVRNYLREVGYDLGQGYWFARPMAADDCFNWTRTFNTAGLQQAV
jgi:diguanylate cyclase (GGDEF)-like protein/PAS domain S-box-containing protein